MFLIILTLISSIISAQDYYYYYGTKVNITRNLQKYVVNFKNDISASYKLDILESKGSTILAESIESNNILVRNSKDKLQQIDPSIVRRVYNTYRKTDNTKNHDFCFIIKNKLVMKIMNPSDTSTIESRYNLEKISKKWLGENIYVFSFKNSADEQQVLTTANNIYESGLIEFAQPVFGMYNNELAGTNDSYYSSQWNLTKIKASDAWDITTGSSSFIIAVIDVGIEENHPDLENNLITGYDVIDDDYTTEPYGNAHGTAASGVAAAVTNNGRGIAGVGYNCKLMPIQYRHSGT